VRRRAAEFGCLAQREPPRFKGWGYDGVAAHVEALREPARSGVEQPSRGSESHLARHLGQIVERSHRFRHRQIDPVEVLDDRQPQRLAIVHIPHADVDQHPQVREARQQADCSLALHRAATLLQLRLAGFDPELALAVWQRDGNPLASFPYPDTAPVLRTLKALGVQVGIISDIHYDLRPMFEHHGLANLVAAAFERWLLEAR
jgi:phosphoglycolate phosphatase-like HAD superfamily hydrolase